MFSRLKLIIENNDLKSKNKALYDENKQNREDIEDLEIKRVHAKLLAEHTLRKLLELEQTDRSGITEDSKKKNRNVIINDLRKQNIKIIKELVSDYQSKN